MAKINLLEMTEEEIHREAGKTVVELLGRRLPKAQMIFATKELIEILGLFDYDGVSPMSGLSDRRVVS